MPTLRTLRSSRHIRSTFRRPHFRVTRLATSLAICFEVYGDALPVSRAEPVSSQLVLIHEKQRGRYPATCEALAGHLKSVSREQGRVTSDDAAEWLIAHGFGGDLRVIGA